MGNNNSIENERKNEAISIALRRADLDAERRMQAAARFAEIERVASQRPSSDRNLYSNSGDEALDIQCRPYDSAASISIQREVPVSANVSRTSTSSTNVSRISTVNSAVPRTSMAAATVSRPSPFTATVPRTSTGSTNIPSTSTVSSTIPRNSTVPATVSRTSTVPATIQREVPVSANVSRTSTSSTNVSRISTVNSAVPRTSMAAATVSRPSPFTATVPRTSTGSTNIPSTSTVNSTIPRNSTVPATVSRTSTVPATVPRNCTVAATVPRTSAVSATVPRTYTVSATAPGTSLVTPTVNANFPTTTSTRNTIPILSPVDASIPRHFAASILVPREAPRITSPATSDAMFDRPSTSAYGDVNEQLQAAIIESNHDMIQPSAPLLSELPKSEDRTQSADQNNKQKFKGKQPKYKRERSTSSSFGEVPSILLCGACEGLMVGHVYFCPNEHNQLCATCCLESKPCPQCRLTFVPTDDTRRNFALEEHISKMQIGFTRSQDTNQTNQQREPGRPNSKSQAKRNLPSCLLCELCQQLMDGRVYFCYNKHSRLCSDCCCELRPCPVCQCLTIVGDDTPRNFALEEQIVQMKEKDPSLSEGCGPEWRRLPCDNAAAGCIFRYAPAQLETHRDDCLFGMVQCPITHGIFRRCEWRGTNNTLGDHIQKKHMEHCRMRVDSEAYLHSLDRDWRQLRMIRLGMYNFLLHLQVDATARHVSWAVALLGTAHAARAWTYQIQIYNKEEPMRKITLTNICVSDAVPQQQIFDCCSQVPLSHALSYLNADKKLFYKVYIKKK